MTSANSMNKRQPQCQELRADLQALKSLAEEFNQTLSAAAKATDQESARQAITKAKALKQTIEREIAALREQLPSQDITASWTNPETGETKEITLNLKEYLATHQALYRKHLNLEITPDHERAFRQIWRQNRAEIQREIELYGYDTLLLIPENLPDLATLNTQLIETMPDAKTRTGKVNPTWQSDNFKNGGGFDGVANTGHPKTRIILTKNVQNTFQSGDPLIEATLNKDIAQLTGLDQAEAQRRIKEGEPLPINLEADINGRKVKIEAEGLSLEEYLVFQRWYFEKTGQHLDEKGWTWLLKSLSGSRVVDVLWSPGDRRLHVSAGGPDDVFGSLGGRFSRSFVL